MELGQDRGTRFRAFFLFPSLPRTALQRDRSCNFNVLENCLRLSLCPATLHAIFRSTTIRSRLGATPLRSF